MILEGLGGEVVTVLYPKTTFFIYLYNNMLVGLKTKPSIQKMARLFEDIL
jgi:hypothetical protein